MQNLNPKTRIEILTTIDELNQYLNGNVTKTSIQITLDELIKKLQTERVGGITTNYFY